MRDLLDMLGSCLLGLHLTQHHHSPLCIHLVGKDMPGKKENLILKCPESLWYFNPSNPSAHIFKFPVNN